MLLRLAAILLLSVVSTWPQVPTAPKPAFEAADVHASAPSPTGFQRSVLRGARYEIRNATMQTADQPIDADGGLTPFEAVDRQLGFKLEPQKCPMPVLVIDHVEQKPTEN